VPEACQGQPPQHGRHAEHWPQLEKQDRVIDQLEIEPYL